jgi:N-acetylglucosamine kinase-like BadF-type ATPase
LGRYGIIATGLEKKERISRMALFIGVDGGATRTLGVLTDDEKAVTRCVVGPTNPHVVGETVCLDAFGDVLDNLSRDYPLDCVQAIWFGIAGVRAHADVALMRRVCEKLGVADRARVSDDTLLVLQWWRARVPA